MTERWCGLFTVAKVKEIVSQCGFYVADQRRVDARPGSYYPVSTDLHPRLVELLRKRYPQGLYKHQALALDSLLTGRSVCLATATASGKSLVFIAGAANLLLEEPEACVLVLYPARALIVDQVRKWHELMSPLQLDFGYIDGGVGMADRLRAVKSKRLLLMTPDVVHAWLMPNASEPAVARFLDRLQMVILDEAHVYDGVFGTNVAFMMRRLRAVSSLRQCICATATLGDPHQFVKTLTGFDSVVVGPDADGSPVPAKTILLARAREMPIEDASPRTEVGRRKGEFEMIVEFVQACAAAPMGSHFLGFADSRRMVEQIVAASTHHEAERPDGSTGESEGPGTDGESDVGNDTVPQVNRSLIPYRAGYEEDDRRAVQKALTTGELRGVIATSALELGLDVGNLDLVILLHPPSSRKAFWQRVGRAGRQREGVCVVLDPAGVLEGGLQAYLDRSVEPNRLYLENRYIQYANALCAASELTSRGLRENAVQRFVSVPQSFVHMLANELNPTEAIPPDLSPLKQQATGGAHREFPLRNAVERDFQIVGWGDRPLGSVTYSQAMREAYPGAVYYYMGRPYRITQFDFFRARIRAHHEKRYTTNPILQRMAFPRLPDGLMRLWAGDDGGFVAEVVVQVSERCTGFWEIRGSVKERHDYGLGSPYYPRPLTRFFETTGVIWWTPHWRLDEQGADAILRAFCAMCGVQERDVGLGQYMSQTSPGGTEAVGGWCIYDATYGSLRLTAELAQQFAHVVGQAMNRMDNVAVRMQLERLLENARTWRPKPVAQDGLAAAQVAVAAEEDDEDFVVVVARGERAMFMKGEASEEVVVKDFRYTPKGIIYNLWHPDETVRRLVEYDRIMPIHGVTRLVRWNLLTGEEDPL